MIDSKVGALHVSRAIDVWFGEICQDKIGE
jgi:hypothetical protein